VLARVQHGETLEVTVNGRPVARSTPVQPSGLEDLVVRGRVLPATSSGPIPLPTGPVDTEVDSAEIISEQREDRL
jgi:prevent-host-death family protein